MAFIDVAGFVAHMKSHAVDHGFHVHDERHFVETYSLRQMWEVDLHPEEACDGPIDLHLSLEVDPRALLGFEDEMSKLDDPSAKPPEEYQFPLLFTWALPPLQRPPISWFWPLTWPVSAAPIYPSKCRPSTPRSQLSTLQSTGSRSWLA